MQKRNAVAGMVSIWDSTIGCAHASAIIDSKEWRAQLVDHFSQTTPAVKAAITAATDLTTDAQIEQHRIQLLADFTNVRDKTSKEFPSLMSITLPELT